MTSQIATLGLVLGLLGCGEQPQWAGEPAVVLLVLDGVRPGESFGDGPSTATGEDPEDILPSSWTTLVAQGARATLAINAGITITTPAHVAMLTGQRQSLANYPVSGDVGLYRPELPTLPAQFLHQHDLDASQAMLIGNTGFIEPVTGSLWPESRDITASFALSTAQPSSNSPATQDGPVFDHLVSLLKTTQPRLVVANLHAADRAGHNGDGEDYIDTVRKLDRQLVSLWETLQALPGYADNTTLILVADHGRHHSADDDPPWRNHGDSCTGCRRIPLLLLGPDTRAGAVHTDPVTLPDVAATIAALLDVELPAATGQPLADLFSPSFDAITPAGSHGVAVVDGVVGEQRLLGSPNHRSAVFIDGQQLSDPEAFAAEGMAMASSAAGLWLCFRELHVDALEDTMPWRPRCLLKAPSGDWQDLPPLTDAVGTFWQPVLHADDGGLTAFWIRNPNGTGNLSDSLGDVGVYQSRYADGVWDTQYLLGELSYPDRLAALSDGTLAVVASPSRDNESRHTRRLYQSNGRALSMTAVVGDAPHRVERPALIHDAQQTPWLAALVHTEDRTAVVMGDLQGTWQPVDVSGTGDVLPHVTPVWDRDDSGQPTLLFADVTTAGAHRLCVTGPGEPTECQTLNATFIHQIAAEDGVAHVTVRDESGQWSVERLSWTSLR